MLLLITIYLFKHTKCAVEMNKGVNRLFIWVFNYRLYLWKIKEEQMDKFHDKTSKKSDREIITPDWLK